MSYSITIAGEALARELETEVVAKVRALLADLQDVGTAEFSGEHSGAVNLLNPAPAPAESDQPPAEDPAGHSSDQ
jgi:hypothetical protein